LETFDLVIPTESEFDLAEQLKTFPKIKKSYVDATINGHDIQLKFHGTANEHYYNKQKSYRIKISKDDDYTIDGTQKLQLIRFGEADPAIICANSYAKELGLLAPVGRMIRLKINGDDFGMYYLVEHHDETFFAKHGFNDAVLLSQTTNWSRKETYQRNLQHSTPFDWNIEHLEQKDHPNFTEAKLAYQKLGGFVKSNHTDSIKTLRELDYMAKFLTSAALFNEIHFLTGDNMKWLYDFESKQFYPYYRQESGGKLLPDAQKNNFADFDSHLFNHSLTRYGVAENLKIFKLLLADDKFRNLRNQYLFEEVNGNRFDNIRDSIFQYKNMPLLQNHKESETKIYERMKHLGKQYVAYGHVYGTYHEKSNKLSLFIDALSPVTIIGKEGTILQEVQPIKMNSALTYETFKFEVYLNHRSGVKFKDLRFKKAITGKDIDSYDININKIN
jgi:hypothetical protein